MLVNLNPEPFYDRIRSHPRCHAPLLNIDLPFPSGV